MKILSLSDWLLPSNEADSASVRRYRLRIALIACTALWLVAGVLSMIGTGLPLVGRIALAAEVDSKIAQAVGPINAQLATITAQQAEQGEVLKQIRIDQVATKLRELRRIQCANHDEHASDRLDLELRRAQRDYYALTGESYRFEACP